MKAELPLLKSVASLRGAEFRVVIDTREQTPLPLQCQHRTDTLRTGDYSLDGATESIAIERKSIADLVGCCIGDNRERFSRELHRLRGYQFRRLLIIGERDAIERHEYRSQIEPSAVLNTLWAFEVRYDVPVVFVRNGVGGAELVERWCWYYAREVVLQINNMARAETGPIGRPQNVLADVLAEWHNPDQAKPSKSDRQ